MTATEIAAHIESILVSAGFPASRKRGESDTVHVKGKPVVMVHAFEDGDVNVSWRNGPYSVDEEGRPRRKAVVEALRGKMPEGARVI